MHWCVLGESVKGTAHRDRNIACQDSFRYQMFEREGEWLVVAVADGAGSASRSEVGATRACDEFVRRIQVMEPNSLSTREAMTGLFADVRRVLIDEAEALGIRGRDLACTVLLAIVGPDAATIAQVGDGAIILDDGRGYRVAFWPEPDEYANATDFLTDDRFAEVMRFEAIAGPILGIALLTDGLQRLALDYTARAPFPGFFGPLFRQLGASIDLESLQEPYRAFLDSPQVNERTDDDKTLVIAARLP
jgi:Protein phosphatase 2C